MISSVPTKVRAISIKAPRAGGRDALFDCRDFDWIEGIRAGRLHPLRRKHPAQYFSRKTT